MDYDRKINRMLNHLSDHPADYQTKISLLKANSKRIEKRRRDEMVERVRAVAEIRRGRNAE